MVGVGGSGKQSLSRLAAYICGYHVIQIVISSTYGISDLKEDLKTMYNKAGIKEEGVMFLLTDSQVTNERFLIYINDLLASGNIPDLFGSDEVDGETPIIIAAVTNESRFAFSRDYQCSDRQGEGDRQSARSWQLLGLLPDSNKKKSARCARILSCR